MPKHNYPKTKKLVVLDCQHTWEYESPVPREESSIFCRRCNAMRTVVRIEANFSIKCKNCRMGHSYGVQLNDARTAASRHALKRPGHVVVIYRNVEKIATVGLTEGQLPYEEAHRERQKIARMQAARLAGLREITLRKQAHGADDNTDEKS